MRRSRITPPLEADGCEWRARGVRQHYAGRQAGHSAVEIFTRPNSTKVSSSKRKHTSGVRCAAAAPVMMRASSAQAKARATRGCAPPAQACAFSLNR